MYIYICINLYYMMYIHIIIYITCLINTIAMFCCPPKYTRILLYNFLFHQLVSGSGVPAFEKNTSENGSLAGFLQNLPP